MQHAFMKITCRKRQTYSIKRAGRGSTNDGKGVRRLLGQHLGDGSYYPYLIRRTRPTAG